MLSKASNLRSVTFISDYVDSALIDAAKWLRESDGYGRTNLFYFVDMVTSYDPEVGWCVTLYCGELIKLDVGTAVKPKKIGARRA